MAPWLDVLGLLGSWAIPSICGWLLTETCGVDLWSYCLGIDEGSVCCATVTFCCLGGFHPGDIWLWTGGVGVLLMACWPGGILCPCCWVARWGLATCWGAGESVRLLTGSGLALRFKPARTYWTFTPDCTLRSWPSGKANLQKNKLTVSLTDSHRFFQRNVKLTGSLSWFH